MTTLTEQPEKGFRLSQLIYDTRYRSLTIQVVATILLVSIIYWLIANTIANLAALGKEFDFGFLSSRAGYDINQTLIEYDNSMSHGRAALVGIANTLLVAFLGCIMATIIGVIVGVLRLSKNWVVARLMAVYVEGFRNVPLLLWIILIFALMTESTPQPRDFREGGSASMILWDSVAITNRGIFVPSPVFHSGATLFGIITLLGIVAAYVYRKKSLQKQLLTGEPPVSLWIVMVSLVAGLAAVFVLQGFLLPGEQSFNPAITLNSPELGGFNFTGGLQLRNSLIALWFALSLYTGAFIAEIVRAGILSVSKGQTEAAFALGLRPNRTMNLVILPQALRVIIPPLISQFLNLTKNSSLAIAVGYMDVRATLGGITINQTGRELEGMLLLGSFYLLISLLISSGMNFYNNSVKLKER